MSRRGWAIAASIFIPGAGHFILGNWQRAILWFAGLGLFGYLPFLAVLASSLLWFWIGVAALTALRVLSVVEVARRPPGALPSKGLVAAVLLGVIALSFVESRSIRANLVESLRIPSGGMIPTLQVGDHVFADKRAWTPRRGDVIAFIHPGSGFIFAQRVLAIAGDTIELRDDTPYVNGQPLPHTHVAAPCSYDDRDGEKWNQVACETYVESIDGASWQIVQDRVRPPRSSPLRTVPAGNLFVVGDNRDNSHDSRYWGFVPYENVKGRALFVWWSSGPNGVRGERIGKVVR